MEDKTTKSGKPFKDWDPRPLPWQDFEEEVAVHIEKEIRMSVFGMESHGVKVCRKPKYFSKARESDITFDISIEVYAPPDADSPILIWLWECKDYATEKVTVDEVEEFHHKLQQVGAHKGTMVTRTGFQKGGLELAKTHRIGLMVLKKEEVAVLQFSADGGLKWFEQLSATMSLYTFGDLVEGPDLRTLIAYELSSWEESLGGSW